MILNLTQHPATDAQKKDGVVDVKDIETLRRLLTFTSLPTIRELEDRAEKIVALAWEETDNFPTGAMIGGAPFLMFYLHRELVIDGIDVFYAFSLRESVEKVVDGKVIKSSVFNHLGLVGKN